MSVAESNGYLAISHVYRQTLCIDRVRIYISVEGGTYLSNLRHLSQLRCQFIDS